MRKGSVLKLVPNRAHDLNQLRQIGMGGSVNCRGLRAPDLNLPPSWTELARSGPKFPDLNKKFPVPAK